MHAFQGAFSGVGFSAIPAPSLLPAISLIFLFGKQGIAKVLKLGMVDWYLAWLNSAFPHALMISTTSLRTSDARLL